MPALPDLVQRAQAAHAGGRWAEARDLLAEAAAHGHTDSTLLALRAHAVQQLEGPAAALPLLDAAIAAAPADAGLLTRRARARLATGDLLGARDDARGAVTLRPGDAGAHLAAYEALARLGHLPDAFAALEAAVALRPDDADLRLRAARSLLGARDVAAARAHLVVAVTLRPGDADALAQLLDACLELHDEDAARDALAQLAALAPGRWRRLAARRVALGDPGALAGDGLPAGPEGEAFRATLALWRLDADAARRHAIAASAHDAADPEPPLVLGALDVVEGRPAEAVPKLESARSRLARRPDPDGWVGDDTIAAWLSAAWQAQGDRARAQAWGQIALTTSETWNLPAALQRFLATVRASNDPSKTLGWKAWGRLHAQIAPLIDDPAPLADGTLVGVRDVFTRAAARFGGNRTAWATIVEHGRLVRFATPPWARHEARLIEHRLRTRPPDEVVAAYRALQARFPDEPTPFTYLGETLLWLGRYDEAEPEFHAAIAREATTTWAWIGLGAASWLRGRPTEALAWFRQGIETCGYEGPTVFAYRAEARRALGDADGAREDLDVALVAKPQRLSAWLLRARLDADLGDPRSGHVVLDRIRERLPGLWADVRDLPGLDPTRDDDVPTVLDAVIGLMRGNRSSTILTWFAPGGVGPRFGAWGRWYDPGDLFDTVRARKAAGRAKLAPRGG